MTIMTRRIESSDSESIMDWFEDEIGEGENSVLVYPNLPRFREIYTEYAKNQLTKADNEEVEVIDNNNSIRNEQSVMQPRILLISTFYDTVNAVKHNLSAVGIDVQSHIEDGSLIIVDSFQAHYPDIDGMKKLVASLSERARKEGRVGVTAIINTGFFFLYGRNVDGSNLISYEASLAPKTDGGNVRGFSCYHVKNYRKFNDGQKWELFAQGQKKLLEVTESAVASM
jgi:hypothetical protein